MLGAAGYALIALDAVERVAKAWKRFVRGQKDPHPATKDDVAQLKQELERLREDLPKAIKQEFNHYFGVAARPAEQLVATSDDKRLRVLEQATEAQREHRYAEAARLLESCVRPDLPPEDRAALHNLIGNVYMYMGEHGRAEPHYQAVLAAADEKDDNQARAAALGNLGSVCLQRGDLDKAGQHYQKSLAIHEEIGDKLGHAQCLGNLGLVHRHRGDLDQTEEHHQKALTIDEEIGNILGQANQLGNLGTVYGKRGDQDKAGEYQRRALGIHEEIGNKPGQAQALGNLGNVYRRLGELEKAEESYRKSLAIHREISNKHGQADTLGSLGLLAEQRGDLEKAPGLLNEAKALYEAVGAASAHGQTQREEAPTQEAVITPRRPRFLASLGMTHRPPLTPDPIGV